MKTDNHGTKNIGKLNPSSGLFSKTLKSSLQTVTPYKPESFFVTAEDDADGTKIYKRMLLSKQLFRLNLWLNNFFFFGKTMSAIFSHLDNYSALMKVSVVSSFLR
jgi:hypothetical protein